MIATLKSSSKQKQIQNVKITKKLEEESSKAFIPVARNMDYVKQVIFSHPLLLEFLTDRNRYI